MLPLLREQIDGPLLRLAMDAQVGDGVEPHLCGRLDGTEVGQFDAVQEILLDVAHPRFDAPLLVAASDIARDDRKTVVAGEVVAVLQRLAGTAPVRGSGRNNLRQNLHLRRSPQPIASPPARTHHPQTRWPVRSRCNNEPPTSSAFWERSNDNAGRVGDHKFNPMVLSEIQTAADSRDAATNRQICDGLRFEAKRGRIRISRVGTRCSSCAPLSDFLRASKNQVKITSSAL